MCDFKFIKEVMATPKAVYYGDFDINSAPKAVILNSRQTKTPTGNDPWVSNTLKAVKEAAQKGWTVMASLGMNTWELPLWVCGHEATKQIIIAPSRSDDEAEQVIHSILDDFQLDRNNTGWIFYEASEKRRSEKTDWPRRDKLAIELADIILPVSIRHDGNLAGFINKAIQEGGKKIINDFEVKYKAKKYERTSNPERLEVAIPRKKWDFVIHWTRTCYGPWPNEKSASFYKKLAESGNRYPNNALDTLRNILTEKIIYGSSKNLRKGLKGVAFSSLHPIDTIPIMRWRKRFVRWNFEPYGIAILRKTAINAGILPVIYGKPEIYERLVDSDKPYFQSEGESGAWREEKEWRFIGDFDLSCITPDDMRIIVFQPYEVGALKGITESEVISFT